MCVYPFFSSTVRLHAYVIKWVCVFLLFLPNIVYSVHLDVLSQKVAESQGIVREFAENHYIATGMFLKSEAQLLSRSCVSQRDIQVCVLVIYN